MGTGIVSIALLLDQPQTLSDILLVLDAVTWVALAGFCPPAPSPTVYGFAPTSVSPPR